MKPSADAKPLASIVIPLFNRVELTKACWRSLLEYTSLSSWQVVFVDNASSDSTPEFLASIAESRMPMVTVASNAVNLGFAKACNQGARAAQGEVVVFLNNDTLVHGNWLSPLVEELAEHPETGVAGCKLLYPDGGVQHAGVCIDRKHIPFHMFLGVAADDPRVCERRSFRMVTGACMAVRKREFLDLGGFDEEYVNGHEDVDLCLRYGQSGKRVVYRPDSVVTHLESQSEGRMDHCRANTQRTLRRWRDQLMQDDFQYDFAESERRTAPRPLSVVIKIPARDKRAAPPASTLRAEALARTLCRLGHEVQIHANPDWGRDDLDQDVVLVIPGRVRYLPKPYSRNVLWLEHEDQLKRLGGEGLRNHQLVCSPFDLPRDLEPQVPRLRLAGMNGELSPEDAEALEAALLALADQAVAEPVSWPGGKISVLMATYNRRDRLPEAIRSVLAQSHEDWELIIVNDGGEDVSDVVAGFNDQRILYRDQEHGSKGRAVNTAFALSSGDYLAYLDDDDVWYPEHLERALFMLRNLPGVEMTYSDTVVTTQEPQGEGWRTVSSLPEQCPQVTFADLLETNSIPGISVVHARALFEAVGGMDERLEVLIDFDLWRRLAMRTTPYHLSEATAEHFIRASKATSGEGQVTNLHLSSRRRYLANACRVLRKKMPDSLPAELREAQVHVRHKVQALFLRAQGDHYSQSGNYRHAARCYDLAGRYSLKVCRKFIAEQAAAFEGLA